MFVLVGFGFGFGFRVGWEGLLFERAFFVTRAECG
jgi:hypothetical protein